MPDFLSIEVSGADELRADLANALYRLQIPRDLMVRLGAVFEANINRRFATKVDPQGQPWAPLTESTKARYAAEDKGARRGTLLERTRQMRKSLTANAGNDFVELGMNRNTDGGRWNLALLHETGTARMERRGIFLADPVAGTLGKQDEADLQAEVVAFMDELFGA